MTRCPTCATYMGSARSSHTLWGFGSQNMAKNGQNGPALDQKRFTKEPGDKNTLCQPVSRTILFECRGGRAAFSVGLRPVPIKGKGHWFLVYCTVYPLSGKLCNAFGWYAEIGSNTHSPLKFTLLLFYPRYLVRSGPRGPPRIRKPPALGPRRRSRPAALLHIYLLMWTPG